MVAWAQGPRPPGTDMIRVAVALVRFHAIITLASIPLSFWAGKNVLLSVAPDGRRPLGLRHAKSMGPGIGAVIDSSHWHKPVVFYRPSSKESNALEARLSASYALYGLYITDKRSALRLSAEAKQAPFPAAGRARRRLQTGVLDSPGSRP